MWRARCPARKEEGGSACRPSEGPQDAQSCSGLAASLSEVRHSCDGLAIWDRLGYSLAAYGSRRPVRSRAMLPVRPFY